MDELRAEHYAPTIHLNEVQKDLVAKLRQQSQDDRLAFVMELLQHRTDPALRVAKRVITSKPHLWRLLNHGLQSADASLVRHYIECTGPRLGASAIMRHLRTLMDLSPAVVEKALYWLPTIIPRDDSRPRVLEEFEELLRDAAARGLKVPSC